MMDVNGQFSKKQKAELLHALATAAEARGTDATGIAYNTGGKFHVYKFTFTVLDGADSLYFVKGDNPMCVYYFPRTDVYLYASTEEILIEALLGLPYKLGRAEHVKIFCGDILRIDCHGKRSWNKFDCDKLLWPYPCSSRRVPMFHQNDKCASTGREEYLDELKSVAAWYGFSPGYIDSLLADGFTTDDMEEMLYVGEL